MGASLASLLVDASRRLARAAEELDFGPPVAHVYNPLIYARGAHERYIDRFAASTKRVLFIGMNPGPWGMVQTGIPFGEIDAVRSWMGIQNGVVPPRLQHPKRPIEGFGCLRSEVSGRRLWGLMKDQFAAPEAFFAEHYVGNYCPLAFLESTGKNRTPNALRAAERGDLYRICDEHLIALISALQPQWALGIGAFGLERLNAVRSALPRPNCAIGSILHPSPASPRANRGWAEQALAQLKELGVWC